MTRVSIATQAPLPTIVAPTARRGGGPRRAGGLGCPASGRYDNFRRLSLLQPEPIRRRSLGYPRRLVPILRRAAAGLRTAGEHGRLPLPVFRPEHEPGRSAGHRLPRLPLQGLDEAGRELGLCTRAAARARGLTRQPLRRL